MAAWKNLDKKQVKTLTNLLVDGLKEHRIIATVELEPSGAPGRYRLYVISQDFEPMAEAERQDIVWRVLKEKWTRENQLRITLSLALTKKEAQGTWS